MRTQGQIHRKLRQVIFRHRKREIERGLSQRPCNCAYNGLVELKTPDKLHRIGKCGYKDEHIDNTKRVCDESLGGLKQAQDCPFFRCRNTPEGIKRSFDKKVGIDGTPIELAVLGREYPDVMALYWVLSNNKEGLETPDLYEEESADPMFLLAGGQDAEP